MFYANFLRSRRVEGMLRGVSLLRERNVVNMTPQIVISSFELATRVLRKVSHDQEW